AHTFSPAGGARFYGRGARPSHHSFWGVHLEARGFDSGGFSRLRVSLREAAGAGCAGVSDWQGIRQQRAVQSDILYGGESGAVSAISGEGRGFAQGHSGQLRFLYGGFVRALPLWHV